jgi:acetyl-CoA acyltransferase
MQDAVIVSAARTAIGKAPNGALRGTRSDELAATAIAGALARTPALDPQEIDDVIIGCAMPEAEQGMNVARIAALRAGIPVSVPAVTINRFCASGLQAIAFAAERIMCGLATTIVAGGTESMSLVPMGGNKPSFSPAIFNDDHIAIGYGMGITAENVARQWNISREQQDEFAVESHRRALQAAAAGEFAAEITPYEVVERVPDLVQRVTVEKRRVAAADEGPRRDTSMEGLARLKPVFAAGGSVTAGNSSQMSDGAGVIVLMSEKAMQRFNLNPLGRFLGYAVAGVPPEIMGIGPVKAIPKVLRQTGLQMADLDWIELNEAFAAQSLAVIKDLGLDAAKVNPLGGAIALGHPLGATGAVRTATLLHGLRRRKQRYGMVTMCIGTGMGAAGVFESL